MLVITQLDIVNFGVLNSLADNLRFLFCGVHAPY